MTRLAVVNEAGELLGYDYVFADDGQVDEDFYAATERWETEEVDCAGHATAEDTSGDASEGHDGRWYCDLGPCPNAA